MAECAWVLLDGPGVFVLRGAYPDTAIVDEASAVYESIIAEERIDPRGDAASFERLLAEQQERRQA